MLDKIGTLSYPTWLSENVPYLPKLDLSCVSTLGKTYLDEAIDNSTSATVSGFLHSVILGCSSDDLTLSGGYDNEKEELTIDIVFAKQASRDV